MSDYRERLPSADKARAMTHEQMRQMILQHARQFFFHQGYRSVTTRQVADACGLTQPSLYHYFSNKETLYVAVIQEEIARTHSGLVRILQRDAPLPERIRHITRYLLTTTEQDHTLMLYDVHNELSAAGQATLREAFATGLVAPLTALFDMGQQTYQFRTPANGGIDAATTAGLLLTLISYFLRAPIPGTSAIDRRVPGRAQEIADQITHLMLEGLAISNSTQSETPT